MRFFWIVIAIIYFLYVGIYVMFKREEQVETQFTEGQIMQIGETCCRILISSQETQKKVEEFYRKYLVDSERVEHACETEEIK